MDFGDPLEAMATCGGETMSTGGNYLEAGNLLLSAAAGVFFSKEHTKLSLFI